MKVFSWTTMAVTMLALVGAPGVTRAQQSAATQSQGAQDTQNESNRTGQAGQREGGATTAGRAGQQANQPMDQFIAAAVAIGNEEEIQLAQLAASRAQSDEVKEFARQMQQQHTELGQKLTQITGQRIQLEGGAGAPVVRGQSPDSSDRTQQNQQNQQQDRQQTDRDRSSTSPQGQSSQPGQAGQASQTTQLTQSGSGHELHQLVQIKKEIAQRCLQNAEREMQALSGNDFDKAYMGHQAVLHGQMLAALQVYQQHASPQLAQTLAQAEQVTERHLQHAKQLCKQLDGKSQGSQERSSTDSDRSSTNRSQQ